MSYSTPIFTTFNFHFANRLRVSDFHPSNANCIDIVIEATYGGPGVSFSIFNFSADYAAKMVAAINAVNAEFDAATAEPDTVDSTDFYIVKSDVGDGGWSLHRHSQEVDGIAPVLLSGVAPLLDIGDGSTFNYEWPTIDDLRLRLKAEARF